MMELGYKHDDNDDSFKCGYRCVTSPLSPTPPLSLPRRTTPPAQKNGRSKFFLIFSDRIYISGDTLLVPELKEIPTRYAGQNIDLMLIHLGGTTIPSPSVPLLMVTMDAEQGLGLVKLIDPDLTIPIHYE